MDTNTNKTFFKKACNTLSDNCNEALRLFAEVVTNEVKTRDTEIANLKLTITNLEKDLELLEERQKASVTSAFEDGYGTALAEKPDELADKYKKITTFEKACEVLGYSYNEMAMTRVIAGNMSSFSKASIAMFKLNIVRQALNMNYAVHLTANSENSLIYYPHNPFITEDSDYFKKKINPGEKKKIIGKIESEGVSYFVLDSNTIGDGYEGLGRFRSGINVGFADANVGFLGCASEEIAKHFGKYFGMLITEAKYADMVDFKIIEDKYGNTNLI